MNILGLNLYHGDSAACLVRDGKILAAAEEERFRRVKHWAGFPAQAITFCLNDAQIELSDVDVVAVNSDPSANSLQKIGFVLWRRPEIRSIIDRLRNHSKRRSLVDDLTSAFPQQSFKGKVQRVEHHLSHLASSFLVSPFKEACVASIDGFGDFSSAAWGVGCDTSISIQGKVHFPHSLGIFYQALTQYLGFPNFGDEYKVMGLAPYGRPNYLGAMRQIVRLKQGGLFEIDTKYFRHHREKIDYQWESGSPQVGTLFSDELAALLGPPRGNHEPLEKNHLDIASSVQAMYEEAFFHLLSHLHERNRIDTLTLAGGCAMNSVANGKVYSRSPFKRLYVQSAAGDAGGAIGAAIYAWHRSKQGNECSSGNKCTESVLHGDSLRNRFIMDHAYFGPSASDDEIVELLDVRKEDIRRDNCDVHYLNSDESLCSMTAQAIARGDVVGWFQGRMEWGPRALGNRSILCDPRRPDMKDILNTKIKRRESFRPFAPSVLREHVAEWFEDDDDVPFMMQVFRIQTDKRRLIPAVTHIDGSGRLQTVYKQTNARYWNLIDEFRRISGVPMVLNTSFNENEPVVCRPVEALDCFLRTKMDMLVIGNWAVCRRSEMV